MLCSAEPLGWRREDGDLSLPQPQNHFTWFLTVWWSAKAEQSGRLRQEILEPPGFYVSAPKVSRLLKLDIKRALLCQSSLIFIYGNETLCCPSALISPGKNQEGPLDI